MVIYPNWNITAPEETFTPSENVGSELSRAASRDADPTHLSIAELNIYLQSSVAHEGRSNDLVLDAYAIRLQGVQALRNGEMPHQALLHNAENILDAIRPVLALQGITFDDDPAALYESISQAPIFKTHGIDTQRS